MTSRRLRGPALALLLALFASGCGGWRAYRQGQREAERGNWDLAVARLTLALQRDPDNIGYRIALENARVRASRFHHDEARKALAAENLDRAAEELEIAVKYDPSNKLASDELAVLRARILARSAEQQRLSEFETMRTRAQAVRLPIPMLSPRSPAPIVLRFGDQSLQHVFEALGKVAGVNILFDPDFRDKKVSVNLTGVTFQQALDQLTFGNRLFYKVLDPNTLIIVGESQAKRRIYDDVLLRTYYIQNAETKEIEAVVKPLLGTSARIVSNPTLGAITIVGTLDQHALAARVVELNDKARGEVLVEVQILEVNRTRVKNYGIALSNYDLGAIYAPHGDPGAEGNPRLRAHILSSLNLADFVVNIPTGIFASFLQNDSNVRILAAPKLRASEGKPAELKIGTEVPIPVTTFQSVSPGVGSFSPATSFQYRNVGVNLKLTPRVSAGGEITLEVAAEFSLLGEDRNVGSEDSPLVVPTFLTRNVQGILRVRDGETSLIGGLILGRDAETISGMLGLPSIPIIGRLFSATQTSKEDQEILISLTPHLVRAPKITESDLTTLYVGTQEAVRVPSARPPLFGPEEPAGGEPPAVAPPGGTPVTASPTPSPDAPSAPGPTAAPEGTPPDDVEADPPAVPTPPATSTGAVPETAAPSVPAGGLRPVAAALSPADATLKAGETAAISLVMMNARDLNGLEFVLTYDPALLEAVDVAPGTLLTLDGAAVGIDRSLEAGRVRARLTRTSGVAGSGMVASVAFRGLRPGPAVITVESLTFSTMTGTERAGVTGPARLTVTP
ncbi:MAG TPA: cohesin domain-containing protein [Vicinamibacteria bacterium]|nr:cohesin domain-containing protein [Vicinamibacteria bacterium]